MLYTSQVSCQVDLQVLVEVLHWHGKHGPETTWLLVSILTELLSFIEHLYLDFFCLRKLDTGFVEKFFTIELYYNVISSMF